MKYFFTADEHYGHANIIKYCKRHFFSVKEMDEEMIKKHNEVVTAEDIVIHIGDFTLKDKKYADDIARRLTGKHIFLRGSHDYWLEDTFCLDIWEKNIEGYYIVACHYNMRIWPRSHYNSWQLFGHSHGKSEEVGKQLDVGVDTHNFYPYSFKEIREIMSKKADNFNILKQKSY
jgi:calcineurin-like phosphoesterase family protein